MVLLATVLAGVNKFQSISEAIIMTSKVAEVPLSLIMLLLVVKFLIHLVDLNLASEDLVIEGLLGRAIWLSPG